MNELPLSKKKQLAYKSKRKDTPPGAKKEDAVQCAVNEILEMKQIDYIRIPDHLWFWIKTKCPTWLLMLCSKHLAGWCDNIPIIPVTPKYGLVCLLECKSAKGKTHGKQKRMAKRLNYQIIRSPEDAVKVIMQFEKDAEKIKELLK